MILRYSRRSSKIIEFPAKLRALEDSLSIKILRGVPIIYKQLKSFLLAYFQKCRVHNPSFGFCRTFSFASQSSPAQETTGELTTNSATTIGARRNHLNFTLPDISSSLMEGSSYSMLMDRYKQSGWGEGVKTGANATPYATQRQKWATA